MPSHLPCAEMESAISGDGKRIRVLFSEPSLPPPRHPLLMFLVFSLSRCDTLGTEPGWSGFLGDGGKLLARLRVAPLDSMLVPLPFFLLHCPASLLISMSSEYSGVGRSLHWPDSSGKERRTFLVLVKRVRIACLHLPGDGVPLLRLLPPRACCV